MMVIKKKRCISIIMAVVLAVQMMVAPDIAVFADGTETPIIPTDSGVEINGLNLILSGEIGLTFHVYVPKKYRDGTMVFEFMGEESDPINIVDCDKDSNLRYTATYYLSAIELSEKVTLAVYAKDDTEHQSPLATESYSAEDYVKLLLKDEKAGEKEKNIAKTLINYGHYAQLACSEENGWVIGEDYNETKAFYEPTVSTDVFDCYEIEWQNRTEAFNQFSMSLRLDYKTGIHLYFSLGEKPAVTVNGKKVEVVESERLENNYEIFIEGINALNLGKKYVITVNDVTFTLSAFSYCNLVVSHNTSDNIVDAIRALYEFHQAIVSYNTPEEIE